MLDRLKTIVPVRTGIPILGCIRIEGGKAFATNMEMFAEVPFAVDIPPVCVPYHDLAALHQQANGAAHEYTVKDNRLTFRAGNISARLAVLPVKEFPPIRHVEVGREAVFAKADLRAVSVCMSVEQTRYYLCGVSVRENRLCATDGANLIRRPAVFDGEATLPDWFVRFLLRHAGDEIRLAVDEAIATWRGEDIIVTSKLIDGQFPDETRIYGTLDHDKSWTWKRADLEKALDVAALSDTWSVFENKGGVMTVTATTHERESSWAGTVEGDEGRVCFQNRVLRKVLETHSGDEVKVEFGNADERTIWNGDHVAMHWRG